MPGTAECGVGLHVIVGPLYARPDLTRPASFSPGPSHSNPVPFFSPFPLSLQLPMSRLFQKSEPSMTLNLFDIYTEL